MTLFSSSSSSSSSSQMKSNEDMKKTWAQQIDLLSTVWDRKSVV